MEVLVAAKQISRDFRSHSHCFVCNTLPPLFPEIPHCLAGSPGPQERHGGRAAALRVWEQRAGAPVSAGARGRAPTADRAAHATRGLPAGGGRTENDGEAWGGAGREFGNPCAQSRAGLTNCGAEQCSQKPGLLSRGLPGNGPGPKAARAQGVFGHCSQGSTGRDCWEPVHSLELDLMFLWIPSSPGDPCDSILGSQY